MSANRTFEDVDIWQKAHEFVLGTYKLTENFPKHELFLPNVPISRCRYLYTSELC